MDKIEKILSVSKEKLLDRTLLKQYSNSLIMISPALNLLKKRKDNESNEDALVVRGLMFFAIGFMAQTEYFNDAVLANTDFDMFFGLRTASESPEKFLVGESLNSISINTRYSILALLHPLHFGFITTVQISMVKAIYSARFESCISELGAVCNSDIHRKCNYEITNRLLVEQYAAAGFDSAAEFSLHLIELYRFLYFNVQPIRRSNLSVDELAVKLDKLSAGNYRGGDNYSPATR